ncbi:hypothetical protein [Snuella lapsa]|uniref:Uncharacterized protein n=1 Tax=Snuella lapsa TaxID=870481 RepID=A0ABP6YAF3_9FLAO
MNLENIYIDELIVMREKARQSKNYKLSDNIRDFLDSKHVFVFDTPNAQVVYHRTTGSREDLINELKKEQRAQKLFDAWLYSVNKTLKAS